MRRSSELKKKEIFQFIASQCTNTGDIYKASIDTIIKGLGYGSTPTIKKYLADLGREGKIKILGGRPTAYQLVSESSTSPLPPTATIDVMRVVDNFASVAESLPKMIELIKSLYNEVEELRQFRDSLSEIHRTQYEVLYRRELVETNIEQLNRIEVKYGA